LVAGIHAFTTYEGKAWDPATVPTKVGFASGSRDDGRESL
jgi:hypothetical protein